MQESQSLAELRAQIEAEEAQANAVQAEVTEAEEVEETEEVETDAEEVEQESVTEEGEAEEAEEQPEWAKAESDKEKGAVPVAKHVEIKHKLQGKIADKDARIAELEQKLAERESYQPSSITNRLQIPKEAWEFDGTPEEYAIYKAEIDASNALIIQGDKQQRQAEEARLREESARVEAELDKYYDRVSALIAKGEVKTLTQPEQYKAAENTVIKSLDSITKKGQAVFNKMIAELGEGAEKVVYHLGVNSESRQALESQLRADPTGIRAAMFLAEKKALFNSKPTVKPKPVPKPDVPLQGKAPKVTNHKAAYLKAEKAGDYEAASAARKAARAAGENPNNW